MNSTIDPTAVEDQSVYSCGLIMPISKIEDCGPEHWIEVKQILTEAIGLIKVPKFEAKLVSERDDVGVIHQRIVSAIFESDIVICDLSCKNPNVMFELGLRLAFDKPTVLELIS